MTAFVSVWNVSCALHHLFLIAFRSGDIPSWHLLSIFILPLWSSHHRIPILILWGQQITAFCCIVSVNISHRSLSELDLELVTMFGCFTILGMFIVYIQEATGCLLSTSFKNYKVNMENISSLQKSVTKKEKQVKEERDMTLYISHEIRNPLFNISNGLDFFDQCLESLQSLSNPMQLPSIIESLQSYTSDIRVGIEHCTNLLTNILSLRKIEQGKLDWHNESVNLKRMCQNVATLTKYMAKENVELRVDVPPDVWVLCDERLLSQVLVNLVANAIKFTPLGFVMIRVFRSEQMNNQVRFWSSDIEQSFESSKIAYKSSKKQQLSSPQSNNLAPKNGADTKPFQKNSVDIEYHSPPSSHWAKYSLAPVDNTKQRFVFQVCDTGPGISKEKQGMLFQKFQQAGNHFGTGIGLMLSQKIVQFKDGCIDLVSPSWTDEVSGCVYTGSKFSFSLDFSELSPNTQLHIRESREKSYADAVNCLMNSDSDALETNKILGNIFGMRLLLVDDSLTNLKQLRHKFTKQAPFSQLAWSCELAQTGKAALAIFQEELSLRNNRVFEFEFETKAPRATEKAATSNGFSVVLVDHDLNLDDGELRNGNEVIRCMRQKELAALSRGEDFHKVMVISYSGHVDHEHQNAALDAGADIVWTKPLPTARQILQDILENLCCRGNEPAYDHIENFVQSICDEKTTSAMSAKKGRFLKRVQITCEDDKSMQAVHS